MENPYQQIANSILPENVDYQHYGVIVVRLVIATALGALVAYRPWRYLMKNSSRPTTETAQSQTLIAVAGALMVAVIGDSMARAFGLVGLGAFIRFRSGIKDPRDAAVMFVMIGLGMACGLGLIPLAIVCTMFTGLVLAVFDATGKRAGRKVRMALTLTNPFSAFALVRSVFPSARALEVPQASCESGKLVLAVDADEDLDAAAIFELFAKAGLVGVQGIALLEDSK